MERGDSFLLSDQTRADPITPHDLDLASRSLGILFIVDEILRSATWCAQRRSRWTRCLPGLVAVERRTAHAGWLRHDFRKPAHVMSRIYHSSTQCLSGWDEPGLKPDANAQEFTPAFTNRFSFGAWICCNKNFASLLPSPKLAIHFCHLLNT